MADAIENIDFELPTVNGSKLSLSRQLERSPVLLIFFKHNCPTCQLTLPYLERLYSRYGDSKAAFWAIAQDDKPEASKFAEDYGINYNILLDKKPYKVSRNFDFNIVPNIILLDRDGGEIFRFMGFQKDELEKLNYVLAGLDKGAEPLFTGSDDVPAVKPG
ncbi:MAG: redoxin domain-containing protein [candidate division Zixibacteria bacterium]|nr:redoxin domain-containing protein [candidate division Zixibacteria bacterium]